MTRWSLLKPLLKRFSYAGYSDQVTPNTGYGKGAIHIPNKSPPAGRGALPEGVSPIKPIGT